MGCYSSTVTQSRKDKDRPTAGGHITAALVKLQVISLKPKPLINLLGVRWYKFFVFFIGKN